jgi:hypothetical protein
MKIMLCENQKIFIFISLCIFSAGIVPVADAAMVCGDGNCEYTETVESCPVDCADLACEVDADCATDESCDFGTCMSNCPEMTVQGPCGQVHLGPMENTQGAFDSERTMTCRDGIIVTSVYGNCELYCGNGFCDTGLENCATCPEDCSECTEIEPANMLSPKPWTVENFYRPREPPEGRFGGGRSQQEEPGVITTRDVTFRWSSGSKGNSYRLVVGTCLDGPECYNDIYTGAVSPYYGHFPRELSPVDFPNSGPQAHTVYNIPLTGEMIYVHLTTFGVSRDGEPEFYTEIYRYKTINANPHVLPQPGTRLNLINAKFGCGGVGVSDCVYYVMSADGSIFYGSQVDAYFYSDVQLPLDGQPVLVLWGYVYNGEDKLEHLMYESIFCGDEIVGVGEQCDFGGDNEQVCRIQPDGQCLYCSSECQFLGFFVPPGDTIPVYPVQNKEDNLVLEKL